MRSAWLKLTEKVELGTYVAEQKEETEDGTCVVWWMRDAEEQLTAGPIWKEEAKECLADDVI